jgi:hypothetical protein
MPRRRNITQPTVESQLRAEAVIEMRTTGATFQEIADTLGYQTASGAYRA